MKSGLNHAALAVPEFAFTHHQSLAQEDADAVDADTFGVILMVVDEHAAHMVRMAKHEDVLLDRRCENAECVAVGPICGHQVLQRVFMERNVELCARRRRHGTGVSVMSHRTGLACCIVNEMSGYTPVASGREPALELLGKQRAWAVGFGLRR